MITKKNSAIISFSFATLVACLPFNYIIGSKFAWFSCSSIIIPALGYQYSLLYVIFYIFTKSLYANTASILFLLHRLPLIFATLALQKRDMKISIGVPAVAIFLFSMHPVGSQAFYYAWYWFIPMILYWYVQDSLVVRAISASLVAHAVGSVIWLYTGNIAAATWIALIPLVACERLYIAAGMIACVYIFKAIVLCSCKKVWA